MKKPAGLVVEKWGADVGLWRSRMIVTPECCLSLHFTNSYTISYGLYHINTRDYQASCIRDIGDKFGIRKLRGSLSL